MPPLKKCFMVPAVSFCLSRKYRFFLFFLYLAGVVKNCFLNALVNISGDSNPAQRAKVSQPAGA